MDGKHDEIARGVRVARGRRAADGDRNPRALDDAVEDRRVAVLGRSRDPEVQREPGRETVELLREPERARNVLALDRPRRLEQHEVVVAKPNCLRVAARSSWRRIEIEVVVNRDRVGVAPGVQLAPAPEIDRRVERAVDARRELGLEVREMASLPRQIVMAKADASAVLAHDLARLRVRRRG